MLRRAEALAVIAANFDAVKKTEPWEAPVVFLALGVTGFLSGSFTGAIRATIGVRTLGQS